MISLIHFEPHGPVFHGPDIDAFQEEHGLPPEDQEMFDQMKLLLSKNWAAAKNLLWKHAMMIACGGELPPDEEIAARANEVITKDGVHHLLWDHPPFGVGDDIDMDFCIASIDPPLKHEH